MRLRLLLAFGIIAGLLWLALAYVLDQAYERNLEAAQTVGRNLASSLAVQEASSVRTIDVALMNLADAWVRAPESFAAAIARQQEILRDEPVYEVAIVDLNGKIAYSSMPGERDLDVSREAYFSAHIERRADELYIGTPHLGRFSRQWLIPFSRPIFGRGHEFLGVALLVVLPPLLERAYDDIELGAGGVIVLVRSDGRILAHSRDLAGARKVSLADRPGIVAGSPFEGQYRGQAKQDGVDRFYNYHRVGTYPLVVYVGQAAGTVLGRYAAQRTNYLAFGAIATALLFAVTLLLIARERQLGTAQRNRARLAAIVQSSSDGITSIDLAGTIRSWNPGAERLFGYAAAEAIGRRARDLVVPADRIDELEQARARLLRDGKGVSFDTVRVTKDGRRVDVELSLSAVKGELGETIGISAILRDIADRKRMEELLRRNEGHLRMLFDAFPIGVAHVDRAERVSFANRLYRDSYGSDPAGRQLREYVGESVYAALEPYVKRALAGEEVQFERAFVDDDGTVRTRLLRYVPDRNPAGEVTGFFGLREDITERRRAEEKIRRLNEMLEARVRERTAELSAAVDALQAEVKERRLAETAALNLADRVQDMARRLGQAQEVERRRLAAELHDGVCSNLAAIGLNLALLKRQLPASDDNALQRRVAALIAMIDEAKTNAKDISVDLRPLLLDERELLPALEEYAQKFEASTGIAVAVRGVDRGRRPQAEEKVALFRIAQEALTNCAKHARAKTVAIELNTSAAELELSICDDGVGFDFAGEGKKSGLGLVSMQERAEAIGGRWRIESSPGQGTRVVVGIGVRAAA